MEDRQSVGKNHGAEHGTSLLRSGCAGGARVQRGSADSVSAASGRSGAAAAAGHRRGGKTSDGQDMIEFKLPFIGTEVEEGKLLQWQVLLGVAVLCGLVVVVVVSSLAAVVV